MALRALAHAPQTALSDTAAAAGLVFLEASRAMDGTYGDETPTPAASAEALLALSDWHRLDLAQVAQSAATLLSWQSPDGSWDEAVYPTALVYRALALVWTPNLTIGPEDLILTSTTVAEGDASQLTVKVHNTGLGSAAGVVVRVVDSDGRLFAQDQQLTQVAPGQTVSVRFTLDTSGHGGSTQVFAVVDPDALLAEVRRDDNRAGIAFNVLHPSNEADPLVVAGSVGSNPASIDHLPASVTVTATLGNAGHIAATVDVAILVRGATAATTVVDLPPLAHVLFAMPVLVPPGPAGDIEIAVVVDPEHKIAEARTDNDVAVGLITTVPTVDLSLANLVATPAEVDQGRDVRISYVVANQGTVDGMGAKVIVQVTDAQGRVAATFTDAGFTVSAGGSLTREVVWRAQATGTLTVHVHVDHVLEHDWSNNDGSVSLLVRQSLLANLWVDPGQLSVNPTPALQGQSVTINAAVVNTGGTAAGAFAVEFYRGDPDKGGSLVERRNVSGLASGGKAELQATDQVVAAGSLTYVVRADPEGVIDQTDRSDDIAAITVPVTPLPDLVLRNGALVVASSLVRPGSDVVLKALIVNTGGQSSDEASVDLFEGDPDAGGKQVGTMPLGSIDAGGSTEVQFTWRAGDAGSVRLVAMVNRSRTAVESNYDNNRAETSVSVGNSAVVASNPYFSPNSDGIKDTTIVSYALVDDSPVEVQVKNGSGAILRRLSPDSVSNRSVEWDGRSQDGETVRDGTYRVEALAIGTAATSIGSTEVVVDTNRSPLQDAAGTPLLEVEEIGPTIDHQWYYAAAAYPDDRGFFFYGCQDDPFRCGWWSQPLGSGAPTLLWSESQYQGDFHPTEMAISPDGTRAAYVTIRFQCYGLGFLHWLFMDTPCSALEVRNLTDGTVSWIAWHEPDKADSTKIDGTSIGINTPVVFSPDGRFILFTTDTAHYDSNGNLISHGSKLEIIGTDGSGRRALYEGDVGGVSDYSFSPDGTRITYIGQGELRIVNLDGSGDRVIHTMPVAWALFSNSNARWIPGTPEIALLTTSGDIVAVDPDSEVTRTLYSATAEGGPFGKFALSPFGDAIALGTHFTTSWLSSFIELSAGSPIGAPPELLYKGASAIYNIEWSPGGTFISTDDATLSLRSLANMGLSLMVTRATHSPVASFRGNAADANLESWEIAVTRRGGSERYVIARSDQQVIHDLLAEWSPPQDGVFEAVLTVSDKAGNSDERRAHFAWGDSRAIANVAREPEYISPNGDGVQDFANVTYSVTSPVTVTLEVQRSDGTAVRHVQRTHLDPGDYAIAWDGRDDTGLLVPDGVYQLQVDEYSFRVVVDTIPPVVHFALRDRLPPRDSGWFDIPMRGVTPIWCSDRSIYEDDYPLEHPDLLLELSYQAQDENLKEWSLEQGVLGHYGETIDRGPGQAEQNAQLPSVLARARHFRLTAVDRAGNTAVSQDETPIEQLFLVGASPSFLLDITCGKPNSPGWAIGFGPVDGPYYRTAPPMAYASIAVYDGTSSQPSAGAVPNVDPQVGITLNTLDTIADSIAYWAVLYRPKGSTSGFYVDSNVRVVRDLGVKWIPPAGLLGAYEVAIEAMDESGQSFFTLPVEIDIGPEGGFPPSTKDKKIVACVRPTQDEQTEVGIATKCIGSGTCRWGAEKIVSGTATFTADGETPHVFDLAAGTAAGERIAIPTATLPLCHYQLTLEGTLEDGSTFQKSKYVSLCGTWVERAEVAGPDAWVSVGAHERKNVENVTLFVNLDGSNIYQGETGPFTTVSPPVHVDLGVREQCTLAGLNLVTYLEGGETDTHSAGPDDLQSDSEFVVCGKSNSNTLSVSCASMVITLARSVAPVCHANEPTYVAAVAITSTNEVTEVQAELETASGAPVRPLAVASFTPGKSITVQSAFDVIGLAEGQYWFTVQTRDSLGGQSTARKPLTVDRTLPVVSLMSPVSGATLCSTTDGSSPNRYLEVQGSVSDGSLESIAVRFGEAGRLDKVITFPASGSIQGSLGKIDVTGLPSGDYGISLAAIDASGGSSCSPEVVFHLDNGVSLASVSSDASLFSPDGDGQFDLATITFTLDEAATVSGFVVGTDGQRKAFAEKPFEAGTGSLPWNGTTSDGSRAVDGSYEIQLEAHDRCGYAGSGAAQVEVDLTAPVVRIDSPRPGDLVSARIALYGEVSDAHLAGYQIEIGSGSAPATWLTVVSVQAERNGLLGEVPIIGAPPGEYTIRVTASDTVGHVAVSTVAVQVAPGTLVSAFAVEPWAISPNGDGILDSAIARFGLLAPVNATLVVLGSSGTPLATAAGPLPFPAGESVLGLDPVVIGALPDSEYQIELEASDGVVSESVARPLRIDRVPPEIRVDTPLASSTVTGTTPVAVVITDPLLSRWRVAVHGPTGAERTVAAGTGPASAISTVERDLVDGPYLLLCHAEDEAGNARDVTVPFISDATKPVVAILSPHESGWLRTAAGPVQVVGSVIETNLASWKLELQRDGSSRVLATGSEIPSGGSLAWWDTQGEPDGPAVLVLTAEDRAGNVGSTSVNVLLDSTLPVVRISEPRDTFVKGTVSIKGAVSDDHLATWTLEMANQAPGAAFAFVPIARGTSAVPFGGELAKLTAVPADGTYTLRLTAEDQAGNRQSDIAGFAVDTQPPLAIISLQVALQRPNDVLLTWTPSDDPDLAGYRVLRASGNGFLLAVSVDLSETHYTDVRVADGEYRYAVVAVDRAGNVSQPSPEGRILIDTTPPSVAISAPSSGSLVSGLVRVVGVASSRGDFQEYRLSVGEGTAPTSFTLLQRSTASVVNGTLGSWDASLLPQDSTYTLRLQADDVNGNTAETRATVQIDNLPPAAPVLVSATVQNGGANVVWNANQEPDLAGYVLYRNGVPANAPGADLSDPRSYLLGVSTTTYTDAALPDGTFTYQLQAFDRAMNPSPFSNSITVTVERRAPVARLVTPTHLSRISGPVALTAEVTDDDVASVQIQVRAGNSAQFTTLAELTRSPFRAMLDPSTLASPVIEARAVATDTSGHADGSPESIFVFYDPALFAPDVTASVDEQTVTLRWGDPNPPERVAGYEILRDDGTFIESPVPTGQVTASSAAAGTPAENAFDGNPDTYWSSSSAAPQTWEVVLDRPAMCNEIMWTSIYQAELDLFARVKGVWVRLGKSTAAQNAYSYWSYDPSLEIEAIRFQFTSTPSGRAGLSDVYLGALPILDASPYLDTNVVDGTHAYRVSVTSTFGSRVWGETSARIYAPVIEHAPSAVAVPDAEVSGSGAEPVATIVAERAGQEVGRGSADAQGIFSANATLQAGGNVLAVRAIDASGNRSRLSNAVTVFYDPPPDAALQLSLAAVTGSDVALSLDLTGDTSRVDRIEILRAGSGGIASAGTIGATERSFVDYHVLPGTYVYSARALNASGFPGPVSNQITAVVQSSGLMPPEDLVVSVPAESCALALSWTYRGPSDVLFVVERSMDGGPFQEVHSWGDLRAHVAQDTDLSAGHVYAYRVRAVDGAGNYSAPSNIATGVPRFVPMRPVINAPTIAGVPVAVPSMRTVVAGTADPMARVELVQNGRFGGQGVADRTALAATAVPLVSQLQEVTDITVTPRGDQIAVGYTTTTGNTILALQDRVGTRLAAFDLGLLQPYEIAFSSDEKWIAFDAYDQATTRFSVWIANTESGEAEPFGTSTGSDTGEAAWSPDGTQLAYNAYQSNTNALIVADLATRTERALSSGVQQKPYWISTHEVVAVIDEGSGASLVRVDVTSGAVTPIYTADSIILFDVSRTGGKAAILVMSQSGDRLVVVGLSGEPQKDLGLANIRSFAFSQDGQQFAYDDYQYVYYGDSNSTVVASASIPPGFWWMKLAWANRELMALQMYGLGSVKVLRLAGGFEIPVNLDVGRNLISAISVSDTGDRSQPSESIEVTRPAMVLPDLGVTASVLPSTPVSGEAATALVTVVNHGATAVGTAHLNVLLRLADGTIRPVSTVNIEPLLANASVVTPLSLDIQGLESRVELVAEVTLDSEIDADHTNDIAIVPFLVASSGVPVIGVEARPPTVGAGEMLVARVTIVNPGPERTATARTTLVDVSGTVAANAADAVYAPLPATSSSEFSRTFAAGSLVAGSYQLMAELVSEGAVVARSSTPVTVQPDRTVGLTLVSSHVSYLIGEEVTLQGTVTNRSLNSSLQGATYRLELLDGTSATAYTAPVQALPSLWLGGSSVQETIVPWQALVAGSYQARATVEFDGTMLAQATTPVVVLGRPLLSGTVSVVGDTRTPPAVAAGSDVQLAFTIENQGTSESQGIAAWLVVVDPDTLAIIANQTIPLTGLAAGTQYSGTAFISTAGLPLKVYGVSLVADHDGQANDLLATTRFRVADPAPPQLSLQNLVSGMFVRGSVTPLVRATDDHSGTALVRGAVNGQVPVALALASGTGLDGVWSGSLALGADGPHTLVFSAADAEGNDGLATPMPANPVTVQVVSDTVPPVVAVSGVNEGVCYAAAATPVATASDLNLAAVDTRLNGTPFVSGAPVAADGDYTLSVQATDRAGNQAATVAHFVIDQTAPKIYLSGASEGAFVAADVQYTATAVDAHLTALEVTVNGVASSPFGTLSAEGAYTVTAHAADCAGNLNDAALHFFIDKTPPQLTLSGVADGAYYRTDVTPSWTASDANLASVAGTLNGAPFASGSTISVDGNYLIDVVALDLAGNRTERSAAFVLDRTPPEVTLSGFVEGSYVNTDVTPAYSASDADLDHVEATLDGLPFMPGMVVSSEGFHVFVVKAFDRAGNETDRTGTFTIDKTPPEVSISGVADGAHVNVPVTLTFAATDTNLASVTATLNGNPFTSGTTVSAQGNYLLEVVATDKAGNRTEKSVAFIIDNGAPVVTLLGFVDGSYVNVNVYPDYTVTDSDLDQVIATLDSLPFVGGTVVTTEGLHVLQVVATDLAGNRTDRSGSFTIDKTPPAVTLSGFVDGSYVNTNITPAYNATDTNLDTVQATLNGQPFQSGTVVSAEGSYQLVVVATDKAGNRTEQAGSFTIDKNGPTITISGVTDGLLTKENVTPVVTVNDTNLASSSFTLDGQPFVSGTVVTAEGEHHLVAQATDKAGNSTTRNLTFTIDRTAPLITITGVSDGAQYSAAVVPVVTITDDHLTATVVTLNGAPFVSGTEVAQDGSYTLYARGEDGAGNVAERTVSFTIQAGQFQLDKRLAGRFARTLALVRGGWCHEGEHGHGRVKEFLERYLGGSHGLLRVTGHEERFLAEMRSGLYNVMLVLDLDQDGHGHDGGHCHEHCHHDGHCHNHDHHDGHHDGDCHQGHDHHGSGPCEACHDWDGDDHRGHHGWHGEEPYWADEQIEKLIARELTELVYAGKVGVIVVRTHPADAPELRELLGADLYGYAGDKAVRFGEAPIAPLANLKLEEKGVRLKLHGATAVGHYTSSHSGHHKSCPPGEKTQIAASRYELGLGRSMLFGFDFTRAEQEQDAGLAVQRAVEWATPADSSSPLAVAGVELALPASDLETELRIEESLEEPLQALAAVPLAHIDASRLSLEWTLPAHDPTRLLRYYARLPDQIGTYTTSTEVSAVQPSGTQLLGVFELELAVAETGSGLLADARSVVALLPHSGHDGKIRRHIEEELAEIAARQVHHRGDIEKNLEDLFDALDSAADLKTVSPAATRLALDELVRYWEARWYVY